MAADSSPALTKLVPGFEFLQGLVKNTGAALPNVGQWIAPTLDPAEIEKRIEELRTVQFWLEQNARLLATTIQALEVQRMTLSTLRTMNVTVSDLGNAMKLRRPDPAAAPGVEAKLARRSDTKAASAPAGVVDPVQWWSALTQQFTQLAAQAMKDGSADAAKSLAGAVARKSIGAAGRSLKQVAPAPVAMAQGAGRAAAPAPRRKRKAG